MSDERRLYAPLISPVRATALIAANIIEARGWCQKAGEKPDGAICQGRALELAGDACAHAYNQFSGYLRTHFGTGDIESWNDTPGRTQAEVTAALRDFALSIEFEVAAVHPSLLRAAPRLMEAA